MGMKKTPDVPDLPPGTYEFIEVNKKRNWKRIFEIVAVVLIAAIPLLLSIFHVNPTFERVYEVISPAYVTTAVSYRSWGGLIMEARKLFEPASVVQTSTIPSPTATPRVPTPTKMPSPTVTPRAPTPTKIPLPTATPRPPTPTRTPTPTLTITPTPEPSNPCKNKKIGQFCSYYDASGTVVFGKCQDVDGIRTCIPD